MKTKTRNLGLACLLLSATTFTACTAINNVPTESVESQKPAKKISTNGPQDAKEVESFMNSVLVDKMGKYNVNGSNFVVVKDGKVLLNKGYGYADKDKKIPVDKDTVFQIASVSKTFTGLAAMQLADKGAIDLNHDIHEYLDGLEVPNKTRTPLTMFNLLTYTSGVDLPDITTYTSPDYINQEIPMKEFLKEHMPTVVRTPGESYTYDNFAFLLAGYAIENVSGLRFDQYMEKNIFKPLEMRSTSTRFTPELLDRMAVHYDDKGTPHPTSGHAPTDGPQGSILSTGDDMAKYLTMFQQQGKFKGKEIISEKSLEQMQSYQVFADKTLPMTTVGGFEGFFNDLMNGHHVILKGGSMPGHQSLIALLPKSNTAFYMSYNNDSMMSIEVFEEFMDHYFPEKKKPKKSTYTPLSSKEAAKYIGLYQNTRFHFLKYRFTYKNGSLFMEAGPSGKHTLKMVHPLLFEDEAGNKLAFKKDHQNRIKYFYYTNSTGLDFIADAQKMPTKKPFSDVPHDSLYKTHIDNLYAFDIFKTQPDNRFHPEGNMTQGEFADLLLRAHGWFGFPDDIEKNKAKIISGIPNYNRNTVITRQTAAVMIQNLKQILPAPKVKITGKTDKWAIEATQALVSQGIIDPDIKPKADGSIDFRSKQPLLRQEASALLDKAFGYYTLPLKIK